MMNKHVEVFLSLYKLLEDLRQASDRVTVGAMEKKVVRASWTKEKAEDPILSWSNRELNPGPHADHLMLSMRSTN